MLMMLGLALVLAFLLTRPSQKFMAWILRRNAASLAEYDLVPGPVCSDAVLAAGGFLALAAGLALPHSLAGKIFSAFMLFWLWLLWLIDWRFQFIFDDTLLPLLLAGICATPWLPHSLTQRLLAGGGALLFFALLAILGRGALGGGDVKLMAVLGIWLGMHGIVSTACTGFIVGGVAAALLLLFRLRTRKDYFAFGPYLIIGAASAWLNQVQFWK